MPGLTIIDCKDSHKRNDFIARIKNEADQIQETINIEYEDLDTSVISSKSYDYPIEVRHYETYTIIIEGMIYNEPKSGFEEAIIDHATIINENGHDFSNYQQWIKDLFGEFLIIVINQETQEIVLLNDRFGRLPFFFYENENEVILSRSLNYIQRLFKRPINHLACAEYLMMGYLLKDKSFYCNINKLLPASIIKIKGSKVTYYPQCYQHDYSKKNKESLEKNAKELARLFTKSIQQFSEKNKNVLLSLSGGMDSRANLAVYMNHQLDFQGVTFLDANAYSKADVNQIKAIQKTCNFNWDLIKLKQAIRDDYKKLFQIKQGLNPLWMSFIMTFFFSLKQKYSDFVSYVTGDSGDIYLTKITPEILIRTEKEMCLYILYKQQQIPIKMVTKLMNITFSTILKTLDSLCDKKPSRSFNALYQEFVFTQKTSNFVFEGEDRNRYYFWSHTPFYNPQFFDYAMSCPDSQKTNQQLRKLFSDHLSKELFSFSDVTYGAINSTRFYFKQSLRTFLKTIYFRLPFSFISYIKQYKIIKKDPLKPQTVRLLSDYIQIINKQSQTVVNTMYLNNLLEKKKVSNSQAEHLLGLLMIMAGE